MVKRIIGGTEMRKICVVILIMFFLFVVGCGSSTKNNDNSFDASQDETDEILEEEKISADEMIEIAEDLDLEQFYLDYSDNVLRAYDDYNGKYYKVELFATRIEASKVWFTYSHPTGFSSMYVSFDEETLKRMSSSQSYTVVGKLIVDKKMDVGTTFEDAIILEFH